MSDDDRVLLTFDQAVALLPLGERIHTFRSTGPVTIAAADALMRANAELSRQIGELNTTIGYQDAMLSQLRACLADTLGFAWIAHRTDYPKYVADVRQRANELIRQEDTDG